jgi:hypothetical protein
MTQPGLGFSRPFKDFGKGFYTTTDFAQARTFAIMKGRRNRADTKYVHEFLFNADNESLGGLRVKRFAIPDIEWLDFIIENRLREPDADNPDATVFDVVIGPVADQAAGPIIENLIQGVYGSLLTDGHRAKSFAIGLLDADRLENQVVFRTEKALRILGTVLSTYAI